MLRKEYRENILASITHSVVPWGKIIERTVYPQLHFLWNPEQGPSRKQFALSLFTIYTGSPPGCVNFDFERGNLYGWTKSGTAFNFQPTYGDNPTARRRGQPARMQGKWWIGTFEKRPNPRSRAGATQGDRPTGTLSSTRFRIVGNHIDFLIGGGCNIHYTRAELVIDGRGVVLRSKGKVDCVILLRCCCSVIEKVLPPSRERMVSSQNGAEGDNPNRLFMSYTCRFETDITRLTKTDRLCLHEDNWDHLKQDAQHIRCTIKFCSVIVWKEM